MYMVHLLLISIYQNEIHIHDILLSSTSNFVSRATKNLASVGILVDSSAVSTDELEVVLSWGRHSTLHLFAHPSIAVKHFKNNEI